jgi:SAM-dependent methyltransferase
MSAQYPDCVARFYDVIYEKNRIADRHFYLRKIRECRGAVMEIGVGTGRLFLESLTAGADIYGIDVSDSMLNILRAQLPRHQHHRIMQGAAEDFQLEKTFALAIMPFRVFSHLLTVDQQLRALNNIGRHLSKNGRLIFDLFIPDIKMLSEGLNDFMDFDGEYEPGKKLRRFTSTRNDLLNQVNHVTMRYEWQENNQLRSYLWPFEMRYFFRWELEHLVSRSNLTLETMEGDFEGNPLGNESKDFVVMCRKQ